MKISVSPGELIAYLRSQINTFFPDKRPVSMKDVKSAVADALERLEFSFTRISVSAYCKNGQATFNHLYSDQYLMFLWFLSNSLWRRNGDSTLHNKVYLLNKALHAFDCSFSTELPNVFIVVHGVGTVLGKARYSDFLTVYHGCTVGQAHGKYPQLGRGAGLGAGAKLLGDCRVGGNASIGAGCTLVNTQVAANSSVFRNKEGRLVTLKTHLRSISAEYFSAGFLNATNDR